MKEFQKRLTAIFTALGFTNKAKDGTLTKDEWTKVFESYKQEYGTDLKADMDSAEKLKKAEQDQKLILQALNEADTSTEKPTEEKKEKKPEDEKPVDVVESVRTIIAEYKILKEENQSMKKTASPDESIETIQATFNLNGPGNTEAHFLGIESPMFDMNKRWNKIAVNPAHATLHEVDEEEHGPIFRAEAIKFGRTLAKRFQYLKENKMLDPQKLASGEFGFDTSNLPKAGLGDQYMIRRQDALIARILTLRTVTEFFPVRYGIQDREMITNAYFTEVSQAYQEGEIWKGGMKLDPEFGHVDDAMAKVRFGTMKEIERQYIGYLNTDGSDPIKWSMIEFALLNIYIKMATEQNKRRMMGIYVKPEAGIPGSYLNASTGVIYTLIRYAHENKLLLNADKSYSDYDKSSMLDCVKEYIDDIQTNLTEDQDLGGFVLYLNLNHQSWWLNNLRAEYGKDTDFSGPEGYLNRVPDTTISIKWLPNMGQFKLLLMQQPGNIQFLEYIAGEMFNIKIKEDMELVKAWSTWKEGTGASFTGPTFKTKEELIKNNYELQQIFLNKPCRFIEPDATKITADPKKSFWLVTGENTQATVITEIEDPRKGIAYIIECGSTQNASKISKSGQFEEITADWAPTKEGDYIMVIINSKGKFLEMERCVGGTREINKLLQPNVPGAR